MEFFKWREAGFDSESDRGVVVIVWSFLPLSVLELCGSAWGELVVSCSGVPLSRCSREVRRGEELIILAFQQWEFLHEGSLIHQ